MQHQLAGHLTDEHDVVIGALATHPAPRANGRMQCVYNLSRRNGLRLSCRSLAMARPWTRRGTGLTAYDLLHCATAARYYAVLAARAQELVPGIAAATRIAIVTIDGSVAVAFHIDHVVKIISLVDHDAVLLH